MSMIMVAIVPNALGSLFYGYFTFLQQFFLKAYTFLDAGTSTAFFTKLSRNNERKNLIPFYFRYSLFIFIIAIISIFLIDKLNLSDNLFGDIPIQFIYFGIFFGFLTWFTQIVIKISDAYAITVSIESIKVAHKIISICLLFFFIYEMPFDLSHYFYYHFSSLLIFIIASILVLYKKHIIQYTLIIKKINIKPFISEFISYCYPLIPFTITTVFVGIFDIWLLQKYAGIIDVGFYGLAFQIASMSFIFTSSMTPVITREFGKCYEEKNYLLLKKIFNRYVPILYSISVYFGIFIFFQSKNIISIFTSKEFSSSFWVVSIMGLYPIHQTYGQINSSIFFVTERTKLYRNIEISSMLIGIAMSLILISLLNLGARGLAIKMVLMQIISVNIELYYNCKLLQIKFSTFVKHQLTTILFFIFPAIISSYIFNTYINNHLNAFLLAGISYTILMIVLIYFFPSIISLTKTEMSKMIHRIGKNYLTSSPK